MFLEVEHTTTNYKVSKVKSGDLAVPLPSKNEQQRIVCSGAFEKDMKAKQKMRPSSMV